MKGWRNTSFARLIGLVTKQQSIDALVSPAPTLATRRTIEMFHLIESMCNLTKKIGLTSSYYRLVSLVPFATGAGLLLLGSTMLG